MVFERFLRARESITADTTEGPTARVIAPASPPQAPSSPKTFAILAIAFATGLFLGSGSALVREYMAASAAAPRARPRSSGPGAPLPAPALQLIGSVPLVKPPRTAGSLLGQLRDRINFRKKPAAAEPVSLSDMYLRDPKSPFSLAIASLCNVVAPDAGKDEAEGPGAILVTGVTSGSGATSIAINLARAAAATGASVLLIDANRTHPTLRELVSASAQPGLIELPGETRIIYALENGPKGELHVVPILDAEEQIVRRLSRRSATPRFEGISDNFDIVVIDGPSLEDIEDARLVAGAVDRVIVVADSTSATTPDIKIILQDLDIGKRKFAGAVMSKAAPARAA